MSAARNEEIVGDDGENNDENKLSTNAENLGEMRILRPLALICF